MSEEICVGGGKPCEWCGQDYGEHFDDCQRPKEIESMKIDPERRIKQLEDAIRTHRSQRADDRCINDDDVLYEALGDGVKCDRSVGDKFAMLKNCVRYIEHRCESGGPWVSYEELEKQNAELVEQVLSIDLELAAEKKENAELRKELNEVLYQQCKEDREKNGPWPEFTGDGK